MAKFCSNCGTAVEEGKKFCISCGSPIAEPQPIIQTQYIPVAPQQPMYVPKIKRPGRGLGISSMVLGILGLVYSFIYGVVSLALLDEVTSRYSYYYRYYSASDVFEDTLPLLIIVGILAILSTCFGGAARSKGYKCGVSASGLVMGIISLAITIATAVIILTY